MTSLDPWHGPLDPVDDRQLYRRPPMFRDSSLRRADIACDMAIPLWAEGGWHAVTLRSLGRATRVTSAAVAGWYGSTAKLHEVLALEYGNRWVQLLRERSTSRLRELGAGAPQVEDGRAGVGAGGIVRAFLPRDWEGETFDRIWLSILEAGQWEDGVAEVVAAVQHRERALVADACTMGNSVDLVTATIRGLRAARCRRWLPMSVEEADAAAGAWNQPA